MNPMSLIDIDTTIPVAPPGSMGELAFDLANLPLRVQDEQTAAESTTIAAIQEAQQLTSKPKTASEAHAAFLFDANDPQSLMRKPQRRISAQLYHVVASQEQARRKSFQAVARRAMTTRFRTKLDDSGSTEDGGDDTETGFVIDNSDEPKAPKGTPRSTCASALSRQSQQPALTKPKSNLDNAAVQEFYQENLHGVLVQLRGRSVEQPAFWLGTTTTTSQDSNNKAIQIASLSPQSRRKKLHSGKLRSLLLPGATYVSPEKGVISSPTFMPIARPLTAKSFAETGESRPYTAPVGTPKIKYFNFPKLNQRTGQQTHRRQPPPPPPAMWLAPEPRKAVEPTANDLWKFTYGGTASSASSYDVNHITLPPAPASSPTPARGGTPIELGRN